MYRKWLITCVYVNCTKLITFALLLVHVLWVRINNIIIIIIMILNHRLLIKQFLFLFFSSTEYLMFRIKNVITYHGSDR